MAQRKVKWSVRSFDEFKSILEFYKVRNGSNAFSLKLSHNIQNKIKQLSRFPFIGQLTDLENVRTIIIGDFQIIYEIFEETILIVTIWDCRRDPSKKYLND